MLAPESFFDLSDFEHAELFAGARYVWEAVGRLPEYLGRVLGVSAEEMASGSARVRELVQVAPGGRVEEGARVLGPALIGPEACIYAGTLVRGPVIVGRGAVVGKGSEVVASVLLNGAHVAHLNFVGHSLLGANVNLAAGAVCSNLKLGQDRVRVRAGDQEHDTGLVKLGAILGDEVQVGCHVVCSPGTLVGPRTWIYPLASLRGYYPADHIIKTKQTIELVPRN